MQITHLFAGIPVADLDIARAWYVRLLGRAPDAAPNESEVMWHFAERASLYVVGNPERAGQALVTVAVTDLDQVLGVATGLRPAMSVTGPSQMRTATFTDPDGNRLTFFKDPAAAD